MIKIAICDDEEHYKIKIMDLLKGYFSNKKIIYKVDIYDSGIQMLEIGEQVKEYDIIFLDINMQELNGIDTAKQIRNYSREIFIVFVTAYITYSPEGYRVNAIRYLLKDHESFEIAFTECLDAIQLRMKDREIEQIFEFQEGKKKVKLNNIIYIESYLHKLRFYIKNGTVIQYTMYGKLDDLEGKLYLNSFCRIHKSYLVNLKYVEDLYRYQIVLKDRLELNVAKQRYKDVENKYISFKGAI